MTNNRYEFKEIGNQRWGIYVQDRLLATLGSLEACESMAKLLSKDVSYSDSIKASFTYKKSVNRFLILK